MAGEGSVFRRADGRWVAQISLGGRENRSYRKRVLRSRQAALDALDEMRGQRRAGVNPSRITVSELLERWVADVRNIRPSTRRGYEAAITYHLVPLIGDIKLTALTPAHVEHMLAVLGPRMSPKHLRNIHAVLRVALKSAVRMGLIGRNVAASEFVDAPRVPDAEPRALTAAEVRRLLRAAEHDPLEAVIVLALGTGLRQGEILGLAWEDVDLTVGQLQVRRALQRRDGKYVRAPLKTDRSRRTVPLAPAVISALKSHRAAYIDRDLVPAQTAPVFATDRGEPLNGSWVTHHFYELCRRAGIPRLPFKNLRTTFGSRLFAAGIPDRRIADLLGHARTRTTQGHYISTSDATQTQALAIVEQLVG